MLLKTFTNESGVLLKHKLFEIIRFERSGAFVFILKTACNFIKRCLKKIILVSAKPNTVVILLRLFYYLVTITNLTNEINPEI